MKLHTLVLVTAFSAFGLSAEAQSCGVLCDEDFWKTASQAEVAAKISKEDFNASDEHGDTVLMVAAMFGTAESVKLLLDAGADVNAQSEVGATALMWAAATRSTAETLKVLLDAGAEINARGEYGATALMFAASSGNADKVKVLLDAGAEINARDEDGRTALMWAARNDISDTSDNVKVLLDAGADASVKNADGKTAWDLAQDHEQLKGTDAYWMLNDARFK